MLRRLAELAALFLKLGTIGFGGPAVHYAAMEEETVQRRKWLTREHYLDLIGASNLIPGPNSTEIAMHVGYHRAGLPGLIVAGSSFIVPAALVTTVFAWIYVEYGDLPQVGPLLVGVKPAVLAIIFTAGWRLGRTALGGGRLMVLGAAAAVGSLAGAGQVYTLLVVSFVGLIWLRLTQGGNGKSVRPTIDFLAGAVLAALTILRVALRVARTAKAAAAPVAGAATVAATEVSLLPLALFFLKVGAVLYGTGYVLIAYLEGGLVHDFQWLTKEQLLDAVAIGQFTPGPILSTATFIGFLVMAESGGTPAGLLGAAVATVAIFLPAFLIVAATGPIVPKLRRSPTVAAFLDAVNAASIGLMAAVTLKLCWDVFFHQPGSDGPIAIQWQSCLLAAIAVGVLLRWKITPAWLVLGGAVAGWLLSLFG